jgi:integrase
MWVNYPDIYASMFNQSVAVRYMDYVYSQQSVGITTYNNTVKMGRAFFNWAKERCYTNQNPFEQIKTKPKHRKTRTVIPHDVRQQITEYLDRKGNLGFNIVCRLIYTSLLRPNEIRQLKVENVDLNAKAICVPAEVAKNHKMRFSAMNQELIEMFEKMELHKYPPKYYLLGGDLIPAQNMAGAARYRHEWDRVHAALNLPKEMQMYSFRDSGIFDMLKSGIDDLSVMQHADHSTLEMTTRYANHADKQLTDLIYSKAPKF